MLRERTTCLGWILAISLIPGVGLCQEQEKAEPLLPIADAERRVESDGLTLEQVSEQRKLAEAAQLDGEIKKQVLDLLDRATGELKQCQGFIARTESDKQRILQAESFSESLQLKIRLQDVNPPGGFGEELDLPSLQTEVLTRTTRLDELKRQLELLEADSRSIDERRVVLTRAKATLRVRLAEARQQLTGDPPDGEDAMVSNARRLLALSRLRALNAEEPAIAAELARISAERGFEILRRRIELNQKQTSTLEAELGVLRRLQDGKRRDEAQEKRTDLSSIPEGTDEAKAAADWLKQNQRLVDVLIPGATQLAVRRDERLKDDAETENRIRGLVEQFNIVQPVGLELQDQLLKLPDTSDIAAGIKDRESDLAQLSFERKTHESQLEKLKRAAGSVIPTGAEALNARVSILSTLIRNETTYIEALRSLDLRERKLVADTEQFRRWLRERVLWIRSNRVLSIGDISAAARSCAWQCSPQSWMSLFGILAADADQHLFLYLAVGGLVVLLLLVRSRLRKSLSQLATEVRSPGCDTIRPTARAVVITVMLAIPVPMLVVFIGLRLSGSNAGTDFIQSVGRGFEVSGIAFLLVNLLKQTCRNDGLGEAHFSWTDLAVRKTRLGLRSILIAVLPFLFIGTSQHHARTAPGPAALERICSVIGLAFVTYFTATLLNPKRGVFADALGGGARGWGRRSVWLWYPLAIGTPLTLAGLTVAGYFFTAYELTWRLAGTIILVAIAAVAQAFLERWILVHRRHLQIEQAVLRIQAIENDDVEAEAKADEEAQVLTDVSQQTHRLINSGVLIVGVIGLWVLWSQVLPAVSFVTQYELWRTTRQVSVEGIVDGKPQLIAETVLEPITLLSVFKAGLVILATVTAARNLPGFLEITILKRLPIEPALRYALRTVARYLLVIAGMTLVFSVMGIGWGKVQWLAAGLTVGLGFGLQEIFANFVSGLIILFERPVRLGDVVTIDNVSGTVSRIQIRATTIMDWDRKEYIVPNKEIVTGRVLNWTLSDQTSRIVIRVGVAYGSDTQLAQRLLTQVADNHPIIQKEPKPLATFDEFGDSTLNLCLRCYMPSLDERLQTMSELHSAINEAFANANIEIAFPQLDVHVDRNQG